MATFLELLHGTEEETKKKKTFLELLHGEPPVAAATVPKPVVQLKRPEPEFTYPIVKRAAEAISKFTAPILDPIGKFVESFPKAPGPTGTIPQPEEIKKVHVERTAKAAIPMPGLTQTTAQEPVTGIRMPEEVSQAERVDRANRFIASIGGLGLAFATLQDVASLASNYLSYKRIKDVVEKPYKILGVKDTATSEEIKTRYRELASLYHPDTSKLPKDIATRKFMEVNTAYHSIIEKQKPAADMQLFLPGEVAKKPSLAAPNPADQAAQPLRAASSKTVEMTPLSKINSITIREAGKRIVAGDKTVLPHIAEGVEKFGTATVEDNLTNKGILPAIAKRQMKIGQTEAGLQKAQAGLKSIEPDLMKVLAGGPVPVESKSTFVPAKVPVKAPRITPKQKYDLELPNITKDLNANARKMLDATIVVIDQDIQDAAGTGKRIVLDTGEWAGISSARPEDLIDKPLVVGKNSLEKWRIARNRLENGYNHPGYGQIPPNIEFLAETGRIEEARRLFESADALKRIGFPTQEEYTFFKEVVDLVNKRQIPTNAKEAIEAREVVNRYEHVKNKLYTKTGPEEVGRPQGAPSPIPQATPPSAEKVTGKAGKAGLPSSQPSIPAKLEELRQAADNAEKDIKAITGDDVNTAIFKLRNGEYKTDQGLMVPALLNKITALEDFEGGLTDKPMAYGNQDKEKVAEILKNGVANMGEQLPQQAIKITPAIRAMVRGEAITKKASGAIPELGFLPPEARPLENYLPGKRPKYDFIPRQKTPTKVEGDLKQIIESSKRTVKSDMGIETEQYTWLIPKQKRVMPDEFAANISKLNDLTDWEKSAVSLMHPWEAAKRQDGAMHGLVKTHILGPLQTAERNLFKDLKDFEKEFKQIKKETGVYERSKQSALAQRIAEGKATPDEIKMASPGVNKLVDWSREKYDFFIDRINEERAAIRKDLVAKRKDYVTHFNELNVIQKILDEFGEIFGEVDMHNVPASMLQISEFTKPNSPFFKFAKKRLEGAFKEDLVGAMARYAEPAFKQIHLTKATKQIRDVLEFRVQIPTEYEGHRKTSTSLFGMLYPNAYKYWTDWLNYSIGKRAPLDKFVPKRLAEGLAFGRNMGYLGALAGNVSSVLVQPWAIKNAVAELGTYELKGILANFNPVFRELATKNSRVLMSRQFEVLPESGKFKAFFDAGMKPLQLFDYETAQVSWLGAYFKGYDMGLRDKNLFDYADDIALITNMSAQRVDRPPINRAQVTTSAMQFQTFVYGEWAQVKDIIRGALKPSDPKYKTELNGILKQNRPDNLKRLTQLIVGFMILKKVYDEMGLPVPGDDVNFLGIDNPALNSILGNVPGISTIRYGGAPAQRLLTEGLNLVYSKGDRKKEWKNFGMAAARFVPFGGQAIKTYQGIGAVRQGYVGEGLIMSKADKIRALLLGPKRTMAWRGSQNPPQEDTAAAKATYNQVREMVKAGNEKEAQKLLDSLSEDDYQLYKKFRQTDKRGETDQLRAQFLPTYQKIRGLIDRGESAELAEAQKIVDALSNEEYSAYRWFLKANPPWGGLAL